jgi:hypothetical protein
MSPRADAGGRRRSDGGEPPRPPRRLGGERPGFAEFRGHGVIVRGWPPSYRVEGEESGRDVLCRVGRVAEFRGQLTKLTNQAPSFAEFRGQLTKLTNQAPSFGSEFRGQLTKLTNQGCPGRVPLQEHPRRGSPVTSTSREFRDRAPETRGAGFTVRACDRAHREDRPQRPTLASAHGLAGDGNLDSQGLCPYVATCPQPRQSRSCPLPP